jgi:DHA2 family methylenomycin A resistance protein-like MFS transporter
MFDQTSLVVAAPTIAAEFGASLSGLQWLTAMFGLVAASTMPLSGMLGQRLGARTTVRIGLVVLVAGGLSAAMSSGFAVLLATRVVQGIGAALILPNAATLLGGNVDHPMTRARSVGHWMTASSTALLLGPIVSGLLAEHLGWRATFLVNIPPALLTVLLLGRLRNTPRHSGGRVDGWGLVLASSCLALLAWSLIAAGRSAAGWGWICLGFAGAAVLAAAFVAVELRVRDPLLDLDLFRVRKLRLILLACLAYNAAINGTAFLLSVHFHDQRGLSSSAVGLLIMVANLGMPLAGFLVTALRGRLRNLQLMALGLWSLTLAYLVLGLGAWWPPAFLLIPLAAIGLGAGILYFVDTNTVLGLIHGPQTASAMAALALMRQIGTVLGIAALASLGQLTVATGLSDTAEPPAFLISGLALAAIATAAAWFVFRGPAEDD